MPIETIIDQTAGVILHTVTGQLTLEAIRSSFAALIDNPRLRKNTPAIWDFRAANASQVSTDEISQIVDFFQGHIDKRAGHKVAIVVADDLGFGLSRMYEFQALKLRAEIEVFRDFEQAKKWATT